MKRVVVADLMMNEINNNRLITNSENIIQKSKAVSRQCKICGAPALFINFGIISCSPCKMFFKRNAEFGSKYFICPLDDHCAINIYTRRTCSSCRLAKCFASGMQRELIRSSRRRKNNTNRQMKRFTTNQPSQLPTLNLLRSDQSTLNINQWTLLSNLIHCYDEHSGLLMAYQFISKQNSLPLKLRYKIESVGEFVTSNMSRVQRIYEKNLDYLSLCSHDRSILLRNTVKHTGCIGGTFVLHQAHLLDDPCFYKSSEVIFGPDVMLTIKPIIDSFDSDITFVKLILTIMGFSTTGYTIYTNTPSIDLIDLKTIIRIQDIYTELTWRYLVYKYNHEQAVKRFCQLIRCLFNINFTIVEVNRVQEYTNMIDTIIEQTEELLITKN